MGKNAAYYTGLGKRVGPRLRERAAPCPPWPEGVWRRESHNLGSTFFAQSCILQ